MPYKDPEQAKACKARYRERHREDLRAKGREYYYEHQEEQAAYRKKYRLANKDELARKYKEYSVANPDKALNRGRRYMDRNRDIVLTRSNNWKKNNPENSVANNNARRARKLAVGGKYTSQEWRDVKSLYDYRCLCCSRQEPEIKLQADHVKPLVQGGPNIIQNIQPLCKSCNSSKHAKHIDYRPAYLTSVFCASVEMEAAA